MKLNRAQHYGGNYLFAIVAMVSGLIASISGKGGRNLSFGNGPNVRIGGALLCIMGVVVLAMTVRDSLRARKKKREGPEVGEHGN